MLLEVFLIIAGVYILISLLILPFQYRFLITLKREEEKHRKKGRTQGEMYDSMNAGELAIHSNMQGNPLFFLANILASIIYWFKHRKKSL
ncbi:DUF3949 domain-containing protein [Bacillus sp. MKU004]|jgi:Protein of unknown function (DUF3949)|uniref:DUF3949 domain-containing protein n=1 Tax=[Bacillus] enclensis TaxID=1402860 RepID=UPI0007E4452C|nr:DUF3949 domain-containing protein [[Bacillus] enclensis]MBH9965983.1 DUF3949 domain-containing protein [[Bacillus] enclensis]OAT81542.1 DUF3949 domain-containing protein [Bacillus sp. MKU004]